MMSRDRFDNEPFPARRRRATSADDCFADEIAIDFPAVGGLVRRVRDAFLGEVSSPASETLTAHVLLSSREAMRGTVVPLDVPVRGTCTACGGRGETWTEPCGDCYGTGASVARHAVRLPVPPGVADGACLRFRVNAPPGDPVRVEVRVAIRAAHRS